MSDTNQKKRNHFRHFEQKGCKIKIDYTVERNAKRSNGR